MCSLTICCRAGSRSGAVFDMDARAEICSRSHDLGGCLGSKLAVCPLHAAVLHEGEALLNPQLAAVPSAWADLVISADEVLLAVWHTWWGKPLLCCGQRSSHTAGQLRGP